MTTTRAKRSPIAAAHHQRAAVARMESLLDQFGDGELGPLPRVVGPDGEAVELPESVFRLLRQVVHHLAEGSSVTVVSHPSELTLQQAADVLDITKSELVEMLEQGEISFSGVGARRRLRAADVLAYRQQHDARYEAALTRLAQLSQELGLYPTIG